VGLILSLGAVADVPDVAIRVGERTAVPAPRQLRRRLEDRPAGLLSLLQNLADAVLAAHDVIEHDATEAAALRAHAHHAGAPAPRRHARRATLSTSNLRAARRPPRSCSRPGSASPALRYRTAWTGPCPRHQAGSSSRALSCLISFAAWR